MSPENQWLESMYSLLKQSLFRGHASFLGCILKILGVFSSRLGCIWTTTRLDTRAKESLIGRSDQFQIGDCLWYTPGRAFSKLVVHNQLSSDQVVHGPIHGPRIFLLHQPLYLAKGEGCFQKYGKTPQIIHFNKVFHEINHPFLGTLIFGNTQIYNPG